MDGKITEWKWVNSLELTEDLRLSSGLLGFHGGISLTGNKNSSVYIMAIPKISDVFIVKEGMLRYESWRASGVEEVFEIDFLNPISERPEKRVLRIERAGDCLKPCIIHSFPTIDEVKYALLVVVNYLNKRSSDDSVK